MLVILAVEGTKVCWMKWHRIIILFPTICQMYLEFLTVTVFKFVRIYKIVLLSLGPALLRHLQNLPASPKHLPRDHPHLKSHPACRTAKPPPPREASRTPRTQPVIRAGRNRRVVAIQPPAPAAAPAVVAVSIATRRATPLFAAAGCSERRPRRGRRQLDPRTFKDLSWTFAATVKLWL